MAPSRFGYLRTPVPADASAEAQADAHACLLDALGIQRIAVLGASAGAPSAMQFCIRHPQRCSALVPCSRWRRRSRSGPARRTPGPTRWRVARGLGGVMIVAGLVMAARAAALA